MFGIEPIFFLIGLVPLIALGLTAIAVATMYKKCGPNQAMLISGLFAGQGDRPYKIVVGGGAVVLPLVQQRNILSLETMTVRVQMSSPVVTRDKVSITLNCTGQIRVKGDDLSIALAAENLLGKTGDEIAQIAENIIGGNLRSELVNLTVEELVQNLFSFSMRVREISISELEQLGLTLTSLNIQDIMDKEGRAYPFES